MTAKAYTPIWRNFPGALPAKPATTITRARSFRSLLEGVLTIRFQHEGYELHKGDSVHLDVSASQLPRHRKNPARFIVITLPPRT